MVTVIVCTDRELCERGTTSCCMSGRGRAPDARAEPPAWLTAWASRWCGAATGCRGAGSRPSKAAVEVRACAACRSDVIIHAVHARVSRVCIYMSDGIHLGAPAEPVADLPEEAVVMSRDTDMVPPCGRTYGEECGWACQNDAVVGFSGISGSILAPLSY
jgi:hypothetical protein